MSLFSLRRDTTSDEVKRLVLALRSLSPAIIDDAAAHAWHEHEAGRLTDSQYFVVVRRLRLLVGVTPGKEDT